MRRAASTAVAQLEDELEAANAAIKVLMAAVLDSAGIVLPPDHYPFYDPAGGRPQIRIIGPQWGHCDYDGIDGEPPQCAHGPEFEAGRVLVQLAVRNA